MDLEPEISHLLVNTFFSLAENLESTFPAMQLIWASSCMPQIVRSGWPNHFLIIFIFKLTATKLASNESTEAVTQPFLKPQKAWCNICTPWLAQLFEFPFNIGLKSFSPISDVRQHPSFALSMKTCCLYLKIQTENMMVEERGCVTADRPTA